MNRYLVIPLACILPLAVGACSTALVTAACQEAAVITQATSPYLIAASPEVKIAVALIGAGAVACGSPEYAAARNVVLAFLASRGVRMPS